MRHTSARALRRRRQPHPVRPTRIVLSHQILARLRAALRSAAWWAPSLAALLAISVALSGAGTVRGATASRALAPAHPWIGRATPPDSLPSLARWQDITDGTAYALHITGGGAEGFAVARGGNLFTFTTPTGDQIAGLVPLVKLADQSYAQSTAKDPTTLGGCVGGSLLAGNQASTPNGPAGASATHQVAVALQARFDQYLLVAYVHILYAPAADPKATTAVCQGQAGAVGVTSLEMVAGCAAAGCGSPLDNAMTAPPAYEQAMVQAMKQHSVAGWSTVWALTSRAVTAQYSKADFATLMNQLIDKVGTITAMTPASGPPAVRWDSGGQAYFTVVENVTYSHGGKTATTKLTSYYLLEGGAWMFWFSEPYSG
ncbi:MAG TPA: hypothetical protein VJQ45_13090 [Ktedonobacterales bacterium]|nr:hypothetical protein [Ktedonobacterales bacterium]